MRTKSNLRLKVSEIAQKLEGGQSSASIIKEYSVKKGFRPRTVERYIALAKDILDRNLKKRESIIEAVRADIIAEEAEKWLKSNLEIEARLCAIISSKVKFIRAIQTTDGIEMVECYPSCREVISAMNLLLKMRGAYKIAEISDDEITPIINIVVRNEREKELLESIRAQSLK